MSRFFNGWTILVLWAVLLYYVFNAPYDNTDIPGEKRSGMSLYTDHLTGCQYLSKYWGGLTPRLDKDGNQVGCE